MLTIRNSVRSKVHESARIQSGYLNVKQARVFLALLIWEAAGGTYDYKCKCSLVA